LLSSLPVVAVSSRSPWSVLYFLPCNTVVLIKSSQGADVTDLDARDVELDLEARDYDADFEVRDFDADFEARDYADFEVEARDFEEDIEARAVNSPSVSPRSVYVILRSNNPPIRTPPLLLLPPRSPCQGL
jgi:hypothetical protein